jgi:sulfoxide reductase heme-binding subunit YedZ
MQALWRERNGSFSWFRAVILAALCLPGVVTVAQYYLGYFPVRPITEIIHATGLWTIRFLMISLAVTPFRQSFRWARLVTVRRMIGVAAFSYAVLHLTFYAADNMFNMQKVASEIVLRIYLTIGFAALIILGVLALTSTDNMLKRLGGKAWQRLHRWVYLAGVLTVVHYFMQTRLNVSEPVVVAGLFVWMMAYRLLLWRGGTERAAALPALFALGIFASLVAAFGEAAYYHFVFHAPFLRVLQANLHFIHGPRPAWVVFGISMGIVVIAVWRQWQRSRRPALASA